METCISENLGKPVAPMDDQTYRQLVRCRIRQSCNEAQTLPSLFPVLRALIDESRRAHGRFFLLGSVSPELVRNISETLAGRVGILELTLYGDRKSVV